VCAGSPEVMYALMRVGAVKMRAADTMVAVTNDDDRLLFGIFGKSDVWEDI